MEEPLHPLPIDNWIDAQSAFQSNWPSGISGYKVLETQRDWLQKGYQYGCKVYCPYGDVWNGLVAINIKSGAYELIVQCPTEDTTKLEEALCLTKLVDWKDVVVPFAPDKIIKCLKAITQGLGVKIKFEVPAFRFILERTNPLFHISIPPEVTFDYVRKEHIDLVDTAWPHRYPTSPWFFEQVINMKCGYGLFKNNNLVAWGFISESGVITHLYVIEEERKKGYGQLLTKLISNIVLKNNKDVIAFCVRENTKSFNMLTKLGLKQIGEVSWIGLIKTENDDYNKG